MDNLTQAWLLQYNVVVVAWQAPHRLQNCKVVLAQGGPHRVVLAQGGPHRVVLAQGGPHRVVLAQGGLDMEVVPPKGCGLVDALDSEQ